MNFAWSAVTPGIQSSSYAYQAIACSSDSSKVIAVCNTGTTRRVAISTNSGTSFAEITGFAGNPFNCAVSADGSVFAVAEYSPTGYIRTSANNGGSWAQQTGAGNRYWLAIKLSTTGSVISGISSFGGTNVLVQSTDSGATWTTRTLPAAVSVYVNIFACSDDGAKMILACGDGYIYTSTNHGATWAKITALGSHTWPAVTCSSDGTTMWAMYGGNSYFFCSTDSGSTFATITSGGNPVRQAVAASATSSSSQVVVGLYDTGTITNEYPMRSSDQGASWVSETAGWVNGSLYLAWSVCAVSPDGHTIWLASEIVKKGVAPWYIDFEPRVGGVVAAGDIDTGKFAFLTVGGVKTAYTPDASFTWSTATGIADDPSYGYASMSCSRDGLSIVATTADYRLITSADGGTSWNDRSALVSNCQHAKISANGAIIIAASDRDGSIINAGWIYVSTDMGASWTAATALGRKGQDDLWSGGIALSSNGSLLYVCLGTALMRSSDSGTTWVTIPSPSGLTLADVACSYDGWKLVVSTSLGAASCSTDGGQTWSTATTAAFLYGDFPTRVAISGDGAIVYAAGATTLLGQCVLKSTNAGLAWAPVAATGDTNQVYSAIATDGDGHTLIAAPLYHSTVGPLCVSVNGGQSWTRDSGITTGLGVNTDSATNGIALNDTGAVAFVGTTSIYTGYDVDGGIRINTDLGNVTVGGVVLGSTITVSRNLGLDAHVGGISLTGTLLVPLMIDAELSVGGINLTAVIPFINYLDFEASVGGMAFDAALGATTNLSGALRVGGMTLIAGAPVFGVNLAVGGVKTTAELLSTRNLSGALNVGGMKLSAGEAFLGSLSADLVVGRVQLTAGLQISQSLSAALNTGGAQVTATEYSGGLLSGTVKVGREVFAMGLYEACYLSANLHVGGLGLYAMLFAAAKGDFETWVVNALTMGHSTYTNFGFNSLVQFQGQVLGASSSGIYVFDAENDAGTEIVGRISTLTTDMSATGMKICTRATLDCHGDGDAEVTLVAENLDDVEDKLESTDSVEIESPRTWRNERLRFGRGMKARYWHTRIELRGRVKVASLELTADSVSARVR